MGSKLTQLLWGGVYLCVCVSMCDRGCGEARVGPGKE